MQAQTTFNKQTQGAAIATAAKSSRKRQPNPPAHLVEAYRSASGSTRASIRLAFRMDSGLSPTTFDNRITGKTYGGPEFWAWLDKALRSQGVPVLEATQA